MFSLNEKVIVITGAAGLLGFEFSKSLLTCGAKVVMLDIDDAKLSHRYSELVKFYPDNLIKIVANITDEIELKSAVKMVKSRFGKITGLINNAALNPKVERADIQSSNRLEEFCLENWQKELNVGLTGAFLCAKHFGAEIVNSGQGGVIVNISSDLALIGPNQDLYHLKHKPAYEQPVKPVSYSVVKSGLIGLTKYLSTYWAKENVRCNAICPGGVETNQSDEFKERLHQLIPLGRMAKKQEYNSTIIWLFSDSCSYLNGSIISIDGGRTAW